MIEGSKVAYAGDTDPFNQVGASGKVIALSASGASAHVKWLSGPKKGQIDLVEAHELVPERNGQPTRPASSGMGSFDATLDMPEAGIQVRATYDEVGEEGLVNVLSEAGHLSTVDGQVEQALGFLTSSIRQDPALGDVLAQLEADEADSLVERLATVLLTDRLKEN